MTDKEKTGRGGTMTTIIKTALGLGAVYLVCCIPVKAYDEFIEKTQDKGDGRWIILR